MPQVGRKWWITDVWSLKWNHSYLFQNFWNHIFHCSLWWVGADCPKVQAETQGDQPFKLQLQPLGHSASTFLSATTPPVFKSKRKFHFYYLCSDPAWKLFIFFFFIIICLNPNRYFVVSKFKILFYWQSFMSIYFFMQLFSNVILFSYIFR